MFLRVLLTIAIFGNLQAKPVIVRNISGKKFTLTSFNYSVIFTL